MTPVRAVLRESLGGVGREPDFLINRSLEAGTGGEPVGIYTFTYRDATLHVSHPGILASVCS